MKHFVLHIRTFLLYHIVALALFFSWYLPGTSAIWHKLDVAAFEWLNGSLQDNYFWQLFWGIANVKATDLYGAFFMVGFSLIWVFSGSKTDSIRRLAQFFYFLVWFELGILALKQCIFPYLVSIDFLRDSPSLIQKSPFMLSQVVPWLKIKDSSHWSFPGDHAFIIFEWAAFIMVFAGWRLGIIAFISSIFFILPRLFAGAHWISDSLAGSLPLALIIVAWATCTPIYPTAISLFDRISKRILTFSLKGKKHATAS